MLTMKILMILNERKSFVSIRFFNNLSPFLIVGLCLRCCCFLFFFLLFVRCADELTEFDTDELLADEEVEDENSSNA